MISTVGSFYEIRKFLRVLRSLASLCDPPGAALQGAVLAVLIEKRRYSFTRMVSIGEFRNNPVSRVSPRLVPKEASLRRATDTIGPAGSP